MEKFLYDIRRCQIFAVLILAALWLAIAGCAGSGKPPYDVNSYLLNYPVPIPEKKERLEAIIKMNRFSIAAAFNTVNMIFSKDSYGMDSFNYSRWAVNPADMVADSLLRDLRAAGLFQAVFSRHDADDGRFILSGGIEEFFLRTDQGPKAAVMGITLSLSDTQSKDTGKKILFQKKYIKEVVLQEASPRGYCQAASQGLQALSEQMSTDIYNAIKSTTP